MSKKHPIYLIFFSSCFIPYINISFKNEFEFITVIGRCAPFKDALNGLGEYPGSMYMEFELTFENEGEY